MHFEFSEGFCYTKLKLRHKHIKRYRKTSYRFPLNPEVVYEILTDIPELRGADPRLDYEFYKTWVKQLEKTETLKNKDFSDPGDWMHLFKSYNFKYQPFAHQLKALTFIRSLPACGLFMETGTGKTYCALVSTEMRIQAGVVNKALVIAPSSILLSGWFEDCEKFTDLKPMVVHPNKNIPWFCSHCGKRYYDRETGLAHVQKTGHEGNPHPQLDWYNYKTARERIYAPGYNLYITSPEIVNRYKDDFINAGFDLVIMDESTMIKNPSSKRRKAIHEVGHSAKYRIAMTGTPVTNSLEDLWSQAQFIDMSLEPTISQFRTKYFRTHPQHFYMRWPYDWAGDDITERLKDRCLYIKKSECLDLPDRLQIVREVEPSKEVRKTYKEFHKELYTKHKNHEISADNALTEVLRLHQIINGFVSKPDGSRHVIDRHPKKVDELKNIMESVDGKVIVWAVYKHDFWAINHYLGEYNPAILNGATSNTEAQVDKFRNDDSCRMMIAHPKSAKYGHTWNFAKTTVYYTYGHSIEDYWQSKARNERIGQDSVVTEFFLVSGEIEKRIRKALLDKEDFASEVMEGFDYSLNRYLL